MKTGMHAWQDAQTSQYVSFDSWLNSVGPGRCYTRNVFAANDSWGSIGTPYMLSDGATATWLSKGPQYQEVIAVALCPFTGSPSSSQTTLAQVAGGAGDTYWTALGNAIKTYANAYQSQIVIRLGWEFNGNWYQWGIGNSWNTATDLINAWRRAVPLIRAKAPNVRFEWCISLGTGIANSANTAAGGLAAAYPGDDVVDLIGADVYDQWNSGWLNILNGTGWSATTAGLSQLRTFAQQHNKPEAYTEWACHNGANGHQDNPYFIAAMYAWFSQGNVDHQCYWNSNSGGVGAPLQGHEVPIIVGSISGTTLTVSSTTAGALNKNHTIITSDPTSTIPIVAGTILTAGSGSSWTVSRSQNVPSQTINGLPTPRAAQMYQTLFGRTPAVAKIPAQLVGGILVPSSALPNGVMTCDGSNFFVAQL